jgi:hypothetical protein
MLETECVCASFIAAIIASKYLSHGETVHNAFRDEGFEP